MKERFETFGASVRGPGHVRAGLPNQDAFSSVSGKQFAGIILSDGLGSSAFSDKGARAVCRAVEEAMRQFASPHSFEMSAFLEKIKENFCNAIELTVSSDYLATCLWGFIPGDGTVYMGMLGDGLAAAVLSSGEVVSLSDDKAQSFLNIVTSLSLKTTFADWKTLSMSETDFSAMLLCSDGISDDLLDKNEFVREFVREYSLNTSSRSEIESMLESWPVPLHTDDKTVVCLTRSQK